MLALKKEMNILDAFKNKGASMKKMVLFFIMSCGTMVFADPGITIEIDPHYPEPTHPDPNDPNNMV